MDPETPKESQSGVPLPCRVVLENDNGNSDGPTTPNIEGDPVPKTVTKRRPWSTYDFTSILSPSPSLIESKPSAQDDLSVTSGPVTPKRPTVAPRGLSLQMPPQDFSSTSTANLSKRIPVSPKPESSASYPSPASVLPRRSRGLDFSRAATNLHHSTLAESSPESSPVVGSRGSFISRKGLFSSPPNNSSVPESPSNIPSSLWGALTSGEKSGLSSSVGSSNMMEYESGSSSSDSDATMDGEDDTIHITPQVNTMGSGFINTFGSLGSSPGGDRIRDFSHAATKMMSYQRARAKPRRNRWSSSSASGQSSIPSPGPPSPPLLRSIESSLSVNGGYFPENPIKKEMSSRRESLSLGTNDMQLSDTEQSDDGDKPRRVRSHEDVPIPTPVAPTMDDRRNVIRRAVTRRTNMLPKSKGFARIRAALLEEGAPVDTEVKREAEVIRQVRESDVDSDLNLQPSQPTTTASSPNMAPATAGPLDNVEQLSEDALSRRSSTTFTTQAIKNAGGPSFWNNLDERMRTPPPPMMPRGSSSGISDDINMDTPISSVQATTPQRNSIKTSISQECLSTTAQTAGYEVPRKGNKRMRDEDFDPNYIKRRAVSPGLSLQNSPILPQSPLQRDGGWWGTPKSNRDMTCGQIPGESASSNGSAGSVNGTPGSTKRVGLQGMTDTHDGMMNMSIE